MCIKKTHLKMFILLLIIFQLFLVSCGSERNVDMGSYFDAYGIEGSIMIERLEDGKTWMHNEERTIMPMLPASTFKVFNSLVALQTGALESIDDTIRWDGIEREFNVWNQDQTLRTAIRYSTVWAYQEVARRIGQEQMQHFISEADYGNENIGGGVDQFWLDGELRITMRQQLDFMQRLYTNRLPFSRKVIDDVKEIMILSKGENYTLRGKTGWAQSVEPQLGWFVGYLESDDEVYFFVTNIDINKTEDARARTAIVNDIFTDMGLQDSSD